MTEQNNAPFGDDYDCAVFDEFEAACVLPDQESTLASISLLRELGLRLYCVSDRKGYVLSTGKKQVLCIVPSEGVDRFLNEAPGDVAILYFPKNNIVPGKLEPLLDCVKRFCGDVQKHQPDPFRPIPPELHGKMARARLIEPGFKSYAWELTPFGKQCGLVPGYLPLDKNRSCRTFFIRKESWKELEDLLTEARPGKSTAWEIITMEERLKRLTAGLPGNDAYGVELLKRLGRMPLEQYMAWCPDTLENLCEKLPSLQSARTVQEAAARISNAWRSDPNTRKQCRGVIWRLLAWPAKNLQQFPNYERRD